jgi:hypothetical protein
MQDREDQADSTALDEMFQRDTRPSFPHPLRLKWIRIAKAEGLLRQRPVSVSVDVDRPNPPFAQA